MLLHQLKLDLDFTVAQSTCSKKEKRQTKRRWHPCRSAEASLCRGVTDGVLCSKWTSLRQQFKEVIICDLFSEKRLRCQIHENKQPWPTELCVSMLRDERERLGEMRKAASEQEHDEVCNRGRQIGSGHCSQKCQNLKFPTAVTKGKLDNWQLTERGGGGG